MTDFTDDIDDSMLADLPIFMLVSGASRSTSMFYLRAMGGRLEAALDSFFSSQVPRPRESPVVYQIEDDTDTSSDALAQEHDGVRKAKRQRGTQRRGTQRLVKKMAAGVRGYKELYCILQCHRPPDETQTTPSGGRRIEEQSVLPKSHRHFVTQVLNRYIARMARYQITSPPPRTDVFHHVVLSADELQCYKKLATTISWKVAQLYVEPNQPDRLFEMKNLLSIMQRATFDPLLLSRQEQIDFGISTGSEGGLCTTVHVALLLNDAADQIPKAYVASLKDRLQKMDDCGVCLCPMVFPTMLECYHFFCRECINKLKTHGMRKCPLCRKTTLFSMKYIVKGGCGSKVKAVIALIEATTIADPTNYFVVFSGFPGLLSILRMGLENRNIHRYSYVHRSRTLNYIVVMAARIPTDSLTYANHVVVMEPGLNESHNLVVAAVVHRFGLLRPVTVHHILAENTVDVKILDASNSVMCQKEEECFWLRYFTPQREV